MLVPHDGSSSTNQYATERNHFVNTYSNTHGYADATANTRGDRRQRRRANQCHPRRRHADANTNADADCGAFANTVTRLGCYSDQLLLGLVVLPNNIR